MPEPTRADEYKALRDEILQDINLRVQTVNIFTLVWTGLAAWGIKEDLPALILCNALIIIVIALSLILLQLTVSIQTAGAYIAKYLESGSSDAPSWESRVHKIKRTGISGIFTLPFLARATRGQILGIWILILTFFSALVPSIKAGIHGPDATLIPDSFEAKVFMLIFLVAFCFACFLSFSLIRGVPRGFFQNLLDKIDDSDLTE